MGDGCVSVPLSCLREPLRIGRAKGIQWMMNNCENDPAKPLSYATPRPPEYKRGWPGIISVAIAIMQWPICIFVFFAFIWPWEDQMHPSRFEESGVMFCVLTPAWVGLGLGIWACVRHGHPIDRVWGAIGIVGGLIWLISLLR